MLAERISPLVGLTFEDCAAWRRGVLASYENVNTHQHQRSDDDDGAVNITKISFPFQLVLTLLGMLVSIMVGYYGGQAQWKNELAGLRSDVLVGFSMIAGDRKSDAIRMDVIRRDLDEAMRLIKLHDVQIRDGEKQITLLQKGR